MAVFDGQTLIFFGLFLKICTLKGDAPILVKNESVTTNGTGILGELARVVDGKSGAFNPCGCCTAIQRPAWIQLNLTKPYLVERIVLLGRTEEAFWQFGEISVSVGNHEGSFEDKNFTFSNNTVTTAVFNTPIAIEFVRVSGWNRSAQDNYMTICEITVYRQNDCQRGRYGANCTENCFCMNGKCDSINGRCDVDTCQDGWRGISCNNRCEERNFGFNCSKQCSSYCLYNEVCNHVNGQCPNGCAEGYDFANDTTCSTACQPGYFGLNCSNQCSANCRHNKVCNHVNGGCSDGCADGYDFANDTTCSTACKHGYFGLNCSKQCGHCRSSDVCNHTTGQCPNECADGYYFINDTACSAPCQPGYFGFNCSQLCSQYCRSNDVCNHVNGRCPDGCAEGYDFTNDKTCSKQYTEAATSPPSFAATIGSGVGASGVVIIGIVAAVIYYKRRHVKKNSDNREFFNDIATSSASLPQSPARSEKVHKSSNTAICENAYANAKASDSDYYSFNAVAHGIQLHELWAYIREKSQIGSTHFEDEFAKLPTGLVRKHDVASAGSNKGKNRYKELYAYDDSRVVLKKDSPSDSDYINASYIHGFGKLNKFIASQGPTQKTIDDFWRLIWQQGIQKIVMLTNLFELGTMKCIQYWPEDLYGECKHAGVHIKYVDIKETYDYNIRTLQITKGDETKRVNQFHFKSWPDKDVPDTTWCLVDFWRAVDTSDDSNTSPIVVHCSAGVGRSGTFIALDNLIAQARMEKCARPLHVVEILREQRVNMVQTKAQYKYLHDSLAEAILIGTHHVEARQFESVFNYMIGMDTGSKKTRIEKQFKLITKSAEYAREQDKELSKTDLEYDNICMVDVQNGATPIKMTKTNEQLIDLPALGEKRAFIVLAASQYQTVESLWSLVEKQHCKTLIEFSPMSESSQKGNTYFGVKDGGPLGSYYVTLTEENCDHGFVERTYSYKEDSNGSSLKTLKQFHVIGWKEQQDRQSILDLIETVLTWQTDLSTGTPILIKDSSNFRICGLFAVLLSEICRIVKHNGHINLVETVTSLKQQNNHIIHNAAQLRFCYEAILAYVQKTGTYQNF